ncbi:MAG TPA: TAXI family TRAP transporter solute-binding subunit, partial [Rhodopila sp.]|nr:TAXI family TRAP transporter solute-binding subunit [Rhodopila sp.]
SVQNLGDLLHLKGVDLALVASDAMAYAQHANLYPGELGKIAYICKLYNEDVHVCARPEIAILSDLNGKPVNIDVEGAGTNMTARAVFKLCGVEPDFRSEEPTIGQARLERGEIAANVYAVGKPAHLFATVPAGTGLHFLNIPLNQALEQTYIPGGEFTSTDYPTLVPPGQTIETVGVGVVMAVFNWQPGSDRYRNLVAFVDSFFGNFAELLKPPHHPAWHQVNLAASQPGWTRFKPAADWLAEHQAAPAVDPDRANFEAFLAQHGGARLTAAEREATWEYFKRHSQAQAK